MDLFLTQPNIIIHEHLLSLPVNNIKAHHSCVLPGKRVVVVCGYCSILQPEEGAESHLITIQFKWNRQVTMPTIPSCSAVGVHCMPHPTLTLHAHPHTPTLTHSHPYMHSHTCILTHAHSCTPTHAHSYTLTHAHSHMHTLTFTHR